MTVANKFYFVRHGAVTNPGDLFYGRLPGFRLSAVGQAQAAAAAAFLKDRPLAGIYSSPLLRARQTARPIAAAFAGLPVRVSADLNEVFCPFDGQPAATLAARRWDVYAGVQPPYDQPADVLQRALRFVRRAMRRWPGQEVVAVTHMDLIQWLALWALGAPLTVESRAQLVELGLPAAFPAPASITAFACGEDGRMELVDYRSSFVLCGIITNPNN